jgi:hypothetical protein
MVRLSNILSTLLIYRHSALSLALYSVSMALYVLLPGDAAWYRLTVAVIAGVTTLLHCIIAWRLYAVFKQGADPLLYIGTAVFGLTTLVFASQMWAGIVIALLTGGILFLTTLSPRVAQFSILFVHKGWRRLYNVAWLCTVYFFLSTLYGLYLFLASFPWFVMVLVTSLGLLVATFSTIRLYVSDTWRQYRVVYATLLFLFVQVSMVSLLFPFGIFSFGLLLTWGWYLATLLCRFAVTDRGVMWGEQWRYLLIHGVLLSIVVLGFLRWT